MQNALDLLMSLYFARKDTVKTDVCQIYHLITAGIFGMKTRALYFVFIALLVLQMLVISSYAKHCLQ